MFSIEILSWSASFVPFALHAFAPPTCDYCATEDHDLGSSNF